MSKDSETVEKEFEIGSGKPVKLNPDETIEVA
jgi:hypothetical protein